MKIECSCGGTLFYREVLAQVTYALDGVTGEEKEIGYDVIENSERTCSNCGCSESETIFKELSEVDEFEELREIEKDSTLILGWYRSTNYACDSGIYFYYSIQEDKELTDNLLNKLAKELWEQGYEDLCSTINEEDDLEYEAEYIDSFAKVVSLEEMIDVMSGEFGYQKPNAL